MLAMMGLFFLVVCTVGILRPIRNALALDGLGAEDFYKVYLVSAAVVLFAPGYTWLADRVSWRWLFSGGALFFSLNLLLFRLLFTEGSATLGMLFYGWYDLFAAALVTQFFMATQLFFNARNAKEAYPLVIAGGSLGAALGGAITGVFAQLVGTANLLLIAAALIGVFALALPLVWNAEMAEEAQRRKPRPDAVRAREVPGLFADRHVRLIAWSVLLTVVVKQLVDYQFNTLTLQVFETRDAVSAFQGRFNAATQWLPLPVVLALRPSMRRWGVGAALFLLPVAMFLSTLSLALWWSLWAAASAKAADAGLRYSAERTGRELLYVPVPDEIKLKAKAYVDVAVEKGLGKVVSAGVIFVLLLALDQRQIALFTAGLSLLWIGVAVGIRREYVRTLSRSIRGRFASLHGVFTPLGDGSTLQVLRGALTGGEVAPAAFALDLLGEANADAVRGLAPELHGLLSHPAEELRVRALAVLARSPAVVIPERVRDALTDPAPGVRQAAVRVLCAARPEARAAILAELLDSDDARVRTAALMSLALGEVSPEGVRVAAGPYLERRSRDARNGHGAARVELALAVGALPHDRTRGVPLLQKLLADPEPDVVSAALRSAGLVADPALYPAMIAALRSPATRPAARDALVIQGEAALKELTRTLADEQADPLVRRAIPAVLGRIPTQETVTGLLHSLIAPETDQLLDYRILKALNRLRVRHPELEFEPALVRAVIARDVEAARRYAVASAALEMQAPETPALALLRGALHEGWEERRESVFRALGLLLPPREVHRCYLAVAGGAPVPRANAVEWLDQTLGYAAFSAVTPILTWGVPHASTLPAPEWALRELVADGDSWLARCAAWRGAELRLPWLSERLEWMRSTGRPEFRSLVERVTRGPLREPWSEQRSCEMDAIEMVFLLQQVDLLRDARSAHLALLASIAEEIEVAPDTVLIREGEPADALYVVVRGATELHGLGGHGLVASPGMSFGTWALIDEEASLVEARTIEHSRLLRIAREDFYDLLADYPELAQGLLQGLARRIRTLVA